MFRLAASHLQAIWTYCLVAYNYTKQKIEEMSVINIMINFIWLHVSTRSKSSSDHLNLLLWPNSSYKRNVSSLRDQSDKLKWPEDDSLRIETCSHMKFIIIYIVAIDWHSFCFMFSIIIRNKMEYSRLKGYYVKLCSRDGVQIRFRVKLSWSIVVCGSLEAPYCI
jgi:hypothetical protein